MTKTERPLATRVTQVGTAAAIHDAIGQLTGSDGAGHDDLYTLAGAVLADPGPRRYQRRSRALAPRRPQHRSLVDWPDARRLPGAADGRGRDRGLRIPPFRRTA